MSKYASGPGALYIQIMLLEHIELRILPQIIHALGAAAPGAAVPGALCSWSIISGQNLTEALAWRTMELTGGGVSWVVMFMHSSPWIAAPL